MSEGCRFTADSVKDALQELRRAGFRPQIVGSVARTGCSDHDVDISLPFKDGQYPKYAKAMKKAGYTLWSGCEDHMEHDLEEWRKGKVVLDVWMKEIG